MDGGPFSSHTSTACALLMFPSVSTRAVRNTAWLNLFYQGLSHGSYIAMSSKEEERPSPCETVKIILRAAT